MKIAAIINTVTHAAIHKGSSKLQDAEKGNQYFSSNKDKKINVKKRKGKKERKKEGKKERKNEQTNKRKNERTNKRMNTNEPTDGQADRRTKE